MHFENERYADAPSAEAMRSLNLAICYLFIALLKGGRAEREKRVST